MFNTVSCFLSLLLCLALFACQPPPMLVESGLITPTPTPDPFIHYRAVLQPQAQADIEAVAPLPVYHITAKLEPDRASLMGVMQVIVPDPGPELVFRLYPNLEHYSGSM